MISAKSDNENREQRILDAAEALITHYGYDKTTVSDIAREAGVSKGAIYLHFESKDALFEALLRRSTRRYSQRWLERIEADPQGGTMSGIYKNTLYALQESDFMMAIFQQDTRVLGSYIRKPGNILTHGRAGVRAAFLEKMQQAGVIRQDASPAVYAHIMDMLSYGLLSMSELKPAEDIPPLDELIEEMGEMLERALEPEGGASSEAGKAVIRDMIKPLVDAM